MSDTAAFAAFLARHAPLATEDEVWGWGGVPTPLRRAIYLAEAAGFDPAGRIPDEWVAAPAFHAVPEARVAGIPAGRAAVARCGPGAAGSLSGVRPARAPVSVAADPFSCYPSS